MIGFSKATHYAFFFNSIVYGRINEHLTRNLDTLYKCISTKDMNAESLLNESEPNEDLSKITPHFPNTFNLASYINHSEVLQNLLHIKVNLSKIETKPHLIDKLLKVNKEQLQKYVYFLKDYVSMDDLGNFITKNPMIFYESLDDLQIRINYLQSKNFTKSQIQRVVSKNPFWLMFSTTRIDRRLGYFQNRFNLSGNEVRELTTKQAKLITYNSQHIKTNTFVIREEMGFDDKELKKLILDKPKLLMINQLHLLERFKYIHNVMNIDHSSILRHPGVLLSRNFRVKQRHLYLKKLGRDQYDPKKANYIPLIALAEGTDIDFCKVYAKCDIYAFNTFLKTL
ncbi:hypothetical protein ACJJTC_001983 [Scirpophaga incertulas]